MDLFTKILLLSWAVLQTINTTNAESMVNLGTTQLRGQTIQSQGINVSQFLGIRYAEPPINELRFKKPKTKVIYPTVVLAYDNPPSCWQASKYPFPSYDAGSKSEDCLYLNIWTPKTANKQNMKAVIYWVHGGGFRFGGIQDPRYFGAALAALGDVVVVTVNYRLGSFGFLTTGTDDAPGNVGLYDILEGLKWVNKNIADFGGDKDKITIGGDGVGGEAVGLLTVSPLAQGLYRRHIMHSSAPTSRDENNKKLNLDLSQKIAEKVGCADKNNSISTNAALVLDCLRHLPPDAISNAHSGILPLYTRTFLYQFGDELLPSSPRDAIANENFTCKEVLIGNVRDEGSYLMTTRSPRFFGFFGEKNPTINRTTGETIIREMFNNFADPDAVVQEYLGPDDDNQQDPKHIRRQVYSAAGDILRVCPTVYYAEKCADVGAEVYYYLFREKSSDSPWAPWMGVTDDGELPFLFGEPILNAHNYFRHEVQLSSVVINIWSSFAKYGKPSVPWPMYSKDTPTLVNIGPGSGVSGNGTGPHRKHCDFFRSYFGF